MRAALAAALPDIILSDFSLPQFDGMSALAVAREVAPDVPFIFLSGTIGEERAIEALQRGAIDYVLKTNPKRLVPAVQRALEDALLRRTSRLAEQRLARLSGVLQMLSGINGALVRIHSREEVMRETCRLAHQVGGYAVVMVALINPATRMARPVGWAGYDFLADPGREFPVADREADDTSLMGRVIRSGAAVLCEDIAHARVRHRRTARAGRRGGALARLPAAARRRHTRRQPAVRHACRCRHRSGRAAAARGGRGQPVVCAAVPRQAGSGCISCPTSSR